MSEIRVSCIIDICFFSHQIDVGIMTFVAVFLFIWIHYPFPLQKQKVVNSMNFPFSRIHDSICELQIKECFPFENID